MRLVQGLACSSSEGREVTLEKATEWLPSGAGPAQAPWGLCRIGLEGLLVGPAWRTCPKPSNPSSGSGLLSSPWPSTASVKKRLLQCPKLFT